MAPRSRWLGWKAAAIALVGCTATAEAAEGTCPPPGVKPVSPFDLDAYIKAPWYVQAQAPTTFQPRNTLYCVRAIYSKIEGTDPLRLRVDNYSKVGGTGPDARSRGGILQAVVTGTNEGRLAVGPSFLPDFLRGPYWVVAFDDEAGTAIVTGGAPTVQDPETGLCRGAAGSIFNPNGNGEGLWIFTREKNPGDEVVQKLEEQVRALGLDTNVLVRVEQGGCSGDAYNGDAS